MNQEVCAHIRANPEFAQLVHRRGRLAWLLSGIVFVLFFALVLTVAFAPSFVGMRIADGSTLTIGVAAGLFLFVFFWLLTAYYVHKANTDFDALTAEIVKDAVATEEATKNTA